jgi:hypothetical protein
MTTKAEREQTEAKTYLAKYLKPGDTVYTILRHKSDSGMYRAIELITIQDNYPCRLSRDAAVLLEGYDQKWEACRASGAGMDMGFHLVYNLAFALFGDGYALKQSWL